jgi:hypothetical protein
MTANKEPRLKIDIKGTLIANLIMFLAALAMINLFYCLIAGASTAVVYLVIRIKKKQFGGKEKNGL